MLSRTMRQIPPDRPEPGFTIIDGDIGLQIRSSGWSVDGGVVEGQAVCRGVRDELAALLVDGAIIFDGAGVEGDLAVDVRAICMVLILLQWRCRRL